MTSVTGRTYATGSQNYFALVQISLTNIAEAVWLAAGEEAEDADLEAPKVYELVTSLDSLKDRLGSFIASYNEMVRGGHMDLVFFKVKIMLIAFRVWYITSQSKIKLGRKRRSKMVKINGNWDQMSKHCHGRDFLFLSWWIIIELEDVGRKDPLFRRPLAVGFVAGSQIFFFLFLCVHFLSLHCFS